MEEGGPEFQIIPYQDKLQWLGLNNAYVGMNVRNALSGNVDASLTQAGTEYPIRIQLDNLNRENFEAASEWKNGLAWVIIGGLLSSLVLTVYLVSVVYEAIEKLRQKLSKKPIDTMEKKVV